MLLAWKAQGIITFAGYILGFPADTPATIRRDIAIIQQELPVDLLEFFCLTPLPGSEDHQTLWRNGVAMNFDLNIYDTEHACTAHSMMSSEEWRDIYHEAWSLYYSPEHMKTLLRRAAVNGVPLGNLAKYLLTFSTTDRLEQVHPLQGGILRLKHPSERRPGLPQKNAWIFWPGFLWDTIRKQAILAHTIARLLVWVLAIKRDPNARSYKDLALTPVGNDDEEMLDLMTKTTGGRTAVAHIKKIAALTGAVGRS